jgi:hypothetical protein
VPLKQAADGAWVGRFYKRRQFKSVGVVLSQPQLSRLAQRGDFPAPLFTQPGSPALWDADLIEEWVGRRRAAAAVKRNGGASAK